MKEVKHYISDDGKKESTNLNDIIEYESIQDIRNKTYIDIVNYRDRTRLYKLKDKKDLYYLTKKSPYRASATRRWLYRICYNSIY